MESLKNIASVKYFSKELIVALNMLFTQIYKLKPMESPFPSKIGQCVAIHQHVLPFCGYISRFF